MARPFKYPDRSQPYRKRYSIDLHEYDEIIKALEKKEGSVKAKVVKQLIKEALIARGLI